MEIIKVLLITLLAAVAAGCIIGIVWGKQAVKRAVGDKKPLLSVRERIVYACLLAAGALCIVIGIFFAPGKGGEDMMGMEGDAMDVYGDMEEGLADGELFGEGFEDGLADGESVQGDLPDGEESTDGVEEGNEADDGAEDAGSASEQQTDDTSNGDSSGVVVEAASEDSSVIVIR